MRNRQRIALMTRLAIWEKTHKRGIWEYEAYFRGDYIGIRLMKNFFRITAAFFLGVGLWALLELDFVMERLGVLDVADIGAGILTAYGVLTLLYLGLTYGAGALRYRRAAAAAAKRQRLLTEIEREYALESRRGGRMRKPGGEDT